MVFSSFPLYHLDPPNWNQHNQQNSTLLPINESPTHHLISPPPPPPAITSQPPSSGGGGGGPAASRPNSMAERARLAKIPQPEPALKCPRCDSTNTKFCYFNNYSLSQPRHFCKACRRYWTRGGALRNVPVGGGCRRNKRSSNSKPKGSSASAASSSSSSVAGGSFVIPSLPPPTFLCSLADQYNHHQGGDYGGGGGLPFPFLGGLDSGIYPTFDGDSGGGGLGLGFGKAVQSTASGLISQLAAVKMEDSFPRQYMGMGMAAAAGSGGGGGDGQYLGGGGGGWPGDLSGFHPSVSGNML